MFNIKTDIYLNYLFSLQNNKHNTWKKKKYFYLFKLIFLSFNVALVLKL